MIDRLESQGRIAEEPLEESRGAFGCRAFETGHLADDALARAVLPRVLHRLGRGGAVLSRLAFNAGLGLLDGSETDAEELREARSETRRLGWVVAVLGSAAGADLLLVRRDPDGLATLLDLVDEALRDEGRGLDLSGGVPALAPNVGAGWELPWAVATMLLESARATPGGLLLWSWSAEGSIECPRAATAGVRRAARRLRDRMRGVGFSASRAAWRLDFPAAWLRVPAAR